MLPAVGVIALVALGTAGFFIYSYMTSKTQLGSLSADNTSLASQVSGLTQQVNSLTQSNADVNEKLNAASAAKAELENEFSFFVVPPGIADSASADITTDVKGTVSVGAKNQYTVTTALGAKILVKNSTDQKVNDALKPLVGGNVEIVCTHLPGSNTATVTSVNGISTLKDITN
jgi:hypothetical protein